MLKVIQRFRKHCSCHLQGECVLVGCFWKPLKAAVFAETLDNRQHSTRLIPENRSRTLNSSRENLKTLILCKPDPSAGDTIPDAAVGTLESSWWDPPLASRPTWLRFECTPFIVLQRKKRYYTGVSDDGCFNHGNLSLASLCLLIEHCLIRGATAIFTRNDPSRRASREKLSF
jgi:hypothetical protein